MINSYLNVLSFMDTINDWNEKINSWFDGHGDVLTGTLIVAGIFLIGFFGIRVFNKR